jgi:hypothetical protein
MHYTYARRESTIAPEFGSPGPEPAEIVIRAHRLAQSLMVRGETSSAFAAAAVVAHPEPFRLFRALSM